MCIWGARAHYLELVYRQSKRDEAPLFFSSPSPSKERGIKGVRTISGVGHDLV